MKEDQLWNKLKKSTENRVDWTRIEARVGAGIPDLNGVLCNNAKLEFWLELKICKTASYRPQKLWRPSQISWQTKRSKKMLNVWNLVAHPSCQAYYLYNAVKLQRLVEEGPLSVEPCLMMEKRFDDEALLDYISSNSR